MVTGSVAVLFHELHGPHLLADLLLDLLGHLDQDLVAGLLGDLLARLLGDLVTLRDGLLHWNLGEKSLFCYLNSKFYICNKRSSISDWLIEPCD